MAEPPAKRARRTDSSTMWDMNDTKPRASDRDSKDIDGGISRREPLPAREDLKRGSASRDERRQRSRSRDGGKERERDDRRRVRSRSRDGRRERSRSKERRERVRERGDRERDRDSRRDRDRDRSLSKERYGRRDYGKSSRYRERGRDTRSWSRSRSRSRSPVRNGTALRSRRSRSPLPPPRGPKSDRRDAVRDRESKGVNGLPESRRHGSKSRSHPIPVDGMDMDVDADSDDLDQLMRKTMGFASFRSTQNTKVPGNNVYGVRKEKKTEYRQYMNRQGGFNRPLSPSR
ncbi:hypothetical protein AJ79_05568 [Helicocarpus griseus UAMH5409]|uniref:U4/U6.U5 small nuclear ribonucleoprotein 27kDa protein domain-containing protein n=1 Tax=Helicocarpus griseus UAMH5409 TaxID=1447875 RepID=A0A2B7XMS4_9EURO|nr:hypothetical protein AJ79_05568 [Helicocarpus griseus UAMH5409]